VKFAVAFDGRIDVTMDEGEVIAVPAIIEQHLDDVMDELITLAAEDPMIDVDFDAGTVQFRLVIAATNPLLASIQASGTLRAAIHASGGRTPDWPAPDVPNAWGVRLVEMRSSQVTTTERSDEPDGQLATA